MKKNWKLFKYSFHIVFASVSFWIFMAVAITLSALFILVLPSIFDKWNFVEIEIVKCMSILVIMWVIAFFCAKFGEIVADAHIRLFVLSCSISRIVYFVIRVIIMSIIVLVLVGIISIFYYFLDKLSKDHLDSGSVFANGMTLSRVIATTFILSYFGGIVGVSFRYYTKDTVPSIIVFMICMMYGILFIYLEADVDAGADTQLNNIQFLILPTCLFTPLIVISGVVGGILNARSNVGS